MVNLQNPNIPTSTQPVAIDRAIIELNSYLLDKLAWLDFAYGRAWRKLDKTGGRNGYFPLVYLGKIKNDWRYFNAIPDNDKNGQCFFLVKEQRLINQNNAGTFGGQVNGYTEYDVPLYFSVNMHLINAGLLETEIFKENLIEEVKECLKANVSYYKVFVNKVLYFYEDVFAEFDMERKQTQAEKAQLAHFRFNLVITLPYDCP